MATAVQKITLSSSRDIPFNKPIVSQSNVQKVNVNRLQGLTGADWQTGRHPQG